MKSEPVDDAVLWREAPCAEGTLKGLLSVSKGLRGGGCEDCVRGAA
jgi:hypothetical protein